jgi:iron-sulfur cluster repair protein YtfE (RIC family)
MGGEGISAVEIRTARRQATFASARIWKTGRGAILQGGGMSDQQRDVIEVLEHDHREVEEMFKELESLRGASTEEDRARRKELTEDVTIELVRHSVAEEVIVYPTVEDKVSAEEVEHARKEHAEAEETLQRLEKLDVSPSSSSMPNEALPRAAAGPAASLFDRMRDLATGRGSDD